MDLENKSRQAADQEIFCELTTLYSAAIEYYDVAKDPANQEFYTSKMLAASAQFKAMLEQSTPSTCTQQQEKADIEAYHTKRKQDHIQQKVQTFQE